MNRSDYFLNAPTAAHTLCLDLMNHVVPGRKWTGVTDFEKRGRKCAAL